MDYYYIEKGMRIISDLVSFCHYYGGQEFTMAMKHDVDKSTTHMLVTCNLPDMEQRWLDELSRKLNSHRQREVEQDYWELSGESEMSGELTLVGMMIDKAMVEYDGSWLTINAFRDD